MWIEFDRYLKNYVIIVEGENLSQQVPHFFG